MADASEVRHRVPERSSHVGVAVPVEGILACFFAEDFHIGSRQFLAAQKDLKSPLVLVDLDLDIGVRPGEGLDLVGSESVADFRYFYGKVPGVGVVRAFDQELLGVLGGLVDQDSGGPDGGESAALGEGELGEIEFQVDLEELDVHRSPGRLDYPELPDLLHDLGRELLPPLAPALHQLLVLTLQRPPHLPEQLRPGLDRVVLVPPHDLAGLGEVVGAEGHVQETPHVVGLDLVLARVLGQYLLEHLLGFPESVLEDQVVGEGDCEGGGAVRAGDGADQELGVAVLELDVPDGGLAFVGELVGAGRVIGEVLEDYGRQGLSLVLHEHELPDCGEVPVVEAEVPDGRDEVLALSEAGHHLMVEGLVLEHPEDELGVEGAAVEDVLGLHELQDGCPVPRPQDVGEGLQLVDGGELPDHDGWPRAALGDDVGSPRGVAGIDGELPLLGRVEGTFELLGGEGGDGEADDLGVLVAAEGDRPPRDVQQDLQFERSARGIGDHCLRQIGPLYHELLHLPVHLQPVHHHVPVLQVQKPLAHLHSEFVREVQLLDFLHVQQQRRFRAHSVVVPGVGEVEVGRTVAGHEAGSQHELDAFAEVHELPGEEASGGARQEEPCQFCPEGGGSHQGRSLLPVVGYVIVGPLSVLFDALHGHEGLLLLLYPRHPSLDRGSHQVYIRVGSNFASAPANANAKRIIKRPAMFLFLRVSLLGLRLLRLHSVDYRIEVVFELLVIPFLGAFPTLKHTHYGLGFLQTLLPRRQRLHEQHLLEGIQPSQSVEAGMLHQGFSIPEEAVVHEGLVDLAGNVLGDHFLKERLVLEPDEGVELVAALLVVDLLLLFERVGGPVQQVRTPGVQRAALGIGKLEDISEPHCSPLAVPADGPLLPGSQRVDLPRHRPPLVLRSLGNPSVPQVLQLPAERLAQGKLPFDRSGGSEHVHLDLGVVRGDFHFEGGARGTAVEEAREKEKVVVAGQRQDAAHSHPLPHLG